MSAVTVDEIYERVVKPLSREEQFRLVARTLDHLSQEPASAPRSIMELHGLGKETWQGVDAQEYVDSLRQEWDHRP